MFIRAITEPCRDVFTDPRTVCSRGEVRHRFCRARSITRHVRCLKDDRRFSLAIIPLIMLPRREFRWPACAVRDSRPGLSVGTLASPSLGGTRGKARHVTTDAPIDFASRPLAGGSGRKGATFE